MYLHVHIIIPDLSDLSTDCASFWIFCEVHKAPLVVDQLTKPALIIRLDEIGRQMVTARQVMRDAPCIVSYTVEGRVIVVSTSSINNLH